MHVSIYFNGLQQQERLHKSGVQHHNGFVANNGRTVHESMHITITAE